MDVITTSFIEQRAKEIA
jgi:hypothetical protein